MIKFNHLGICALVYTCILCLSACQVRSQKSEQVNSAHQRQDTELGMTSPAQHELLDQDFWVTQLMDRDLSQLDSTERPSMRINIKEQSVGGSTGCNNYMGRVELKGADSIRFGEIISTLRACHNGNPEGAFLQALHAVRSYKVTHSKVKTINLLNQEGKFLISLQAKHNQTSR